MLLVRGRLVLLFDVEFVNYGLLKIILEEFEHLFLPLLRKFSSSLVYLNIDFVNFAFILVASTFFHELRRRIHLPMGAGPLVGIILIRLRVLDVEADIVRIFVHAVLCIQYISLSFRWRFVRVRRLVVVRIRPSFTLLHGFVGREMFRLGGW